MSFRTLLQKITGKQQQPPPPPPLPKGAPPYSRFNPSPRYKDMLARYQSYHVRFKTMTGKRFLKFLPRLTTLIGGTNAKAVLDYGCGKGVQFSHHDVEGLSRYTHCRFYGYDPAVKQFATLPEQRFDGVTCFDVLEHLPEEDLDWVLEEIGTLAKSFVFLSVSCQPSQKTFPNGEPFHITVRPPEWWRKKFVKAFPPDLTVLVSFDDGETKKIEMLS